MKRVSSVLVMLVAFGCARPPLARRALPSPQLDASASRALVGAPENHGRAATRAVRTAFVGEGSLEARGERTSKTKLALEKLAVTAVTTGDVAEMTVEHTFKNDADEQLEGTFRFPVPDGALLTGLAMEIDGKLMDGELVERDKARKAYEQIVDQMLDPALLEWESGQTFKLRVFPIEPKKTKRVVLKLVAPLHRGEDGLFFAYRPPSADGGLSLERVSLVLDGAAQPVRAGAEEVLVKVADVAPETLIERAKEGAYVLAHVRPTFEAAGTGRDAPAKPQAMILLCDRSRSMLEARALQAHTAEMIVSRLADRDRFTVITGDVRTTALAGGLRPPTNEARAGAASFIDAVEPDGASDLAEMLRAGAAAGAEARAAGLEPVFVYLGDATPTWGETRTSELEAVAKQALGGATMHVVILGKTTDDTTARALAAATHGRVLRPKTEEDAKRAAEQIAVARITRRIDDVKVVAPDGVDVPSPLPSTIYEGEDVAVAAFVPKDKETAAAELRIVGTVAGRPFEKVIGFASAAPARDVGKRWAKARIETLQRDGDVHKDEVVRASLEHGIISRYTSFLVLESEEAYARMQIARKAKEAEAGEARVSGKDLESADARTASVSPDHLQPGDPEVRIPAPADAQSVVVVFPFGETKNAVFENDPRGGSWVARFLVDAHTPDGTYEIVVRITHRDGRVKILELPYVVDTQKPNLDVSLEKKDNATFLVRAKQRLTSEEVEAQAPLAAGTLDEKRARYAHVLTDAKRVEVRTPDGQTLSLTHVRLGEFVGTWKPSAPFAPGAKLRVVAVDRALNERVTEVEVR